jgi:3-hydroxybutyryl-CoA dehydrogenase
MGRGIAQIAAMSGFYTRVRDVDERLLSNAMEGIRRTLDKGVEKGKVSPDLRRETLERLSTTTDLAAAVSDADLVIEAVPEDLDLKRRVFGQLDEASPPDAVLATNTSSLSVALIAQSTRRPGRVVGMHFFNPVHLMPLVEVVRHPATDDDALDDAVEAARAMGKEPIVVRDVPGFASSRLGIALGLEAIRMVEDGVASVEDIDKAMELGYRHPMGPLKLTDLVGLDVRLAIAEYLATELGPRFEPPALLREKVEAGHLGRKTGQGFYEYDV